LLPLARSLLLADVVTHEALAEALLLSATRGTALVRALLLARAVEAPRLEQHLERGDIPHMRHVAPVLSLVERLPRGLCERLLALPVRCDARTGTVDVAVVDASDPHPAEEIAYWLSAPVRMVRTSLASLDAALRRTNVASSGGMHALAPPIWQAPSSQGPPVLESEALDQTTEPHIPFALTRRSVAPSSSDGLAPITERYPFGHSSATPSAAPAPQSPTIEPILDRIRQEVERDAIFELVLVGARTVAQRVAVLAIRRGVLVGWTSSPAPADRAALRAVRASPAGNVLGLALDQDGALLTRIRENPSRAVWLSIWGRSPAGEVVIVALRVDRKPVALIIADELQEPTIAARRLEEIAEVAGAAITQALRQRRM
jgi:hypothetical protein